MFLTKVVEEIKHTFYIQNFFFLIVPFMRACGKTW